MNEQEDKKTPEKKPLASFSLSGFLSSPRALKIIVWAGLAGMALILLSALFDSHKTEEASAAVSASASDEYAAEMEQKLREMLLCVDGVTDCRVMVTLESGSRVVYDENGKEPLTECEPTVRGVVVVVDGPTNENTNDEVCRVVKTALHLAEKRVCVVSNTVNEN